MHEFLRRVACGGSAYHAMDGQEHREDGWLAHAVVPQVPGRETHRLVGQARVRAAGDVSPAGARGLPRPAQPRIAGRVRVAGEGDAAPAGRGQPWP
eukprot:3325252-Pyramimonas_sp.AAC.1